MEFHDTPAKKRNPGSAVASLVFGIAAFIPVLGIIFAFLAIIFGIVALKKIKKNPFLKGQCMAVAGIILGGLSFLILLPTIAALAYFGVFSPDTLFISDVCDFDSDFKCVDMDYDGNQLELIVKSDKNYPAIVEEVVISDCTHTLFNHDSVVDPGAEFTVAGYNCYSSNSLFNVKISSLSLNNHVRSVVSGTVSVKN